jgi:hypothetical protein
MLGPRLVYFMITFINPIFKSKIENYGIFAVFEAVREEKSIKENIFSFVFVFLK